MSPRDPGRRGQRGAGAARQWRKRCLGRAAAAEGGGGLAAAGGEEGSPHEQAIEKGRAAERPGWRRRACAPRGPAPSPSPSHLTRGKPSAQPPKPAAGWAELAEHKEGDRGCARGPRSRTFCRQNPLGFPTRHSRSHPAQGAPGSPRRARRGRGQPPGVAGWGWGPGLCPLSLSPEPPAETRPHQRSKQPARGRLPLWGPLVNPDPTSLWSGL